MQADQKMEKDPQHTHTSTHGLMHAAQSERQMLYLRRSRVASISRFGVQNKKLKDSVTPFKPWERTPKACQATACVASYASVTCK